MDVNEIEKDIKSMEKERKRLYKEYIEPINKKIQIAKNKKSELIENYVLSDYSLIKEKYDETIDENEINIKE
jgi:hypothetical protein